MAARSKGKLEVKVPAASGTALVLGFLIDWLIQHFVYKGSAVPGVVKAAVDAAVPAVMAFAGGYLAPHTHRPDLAPVNAAPNVPPPAAPPPGPVG